MKLLYYKPITTAYKECGYFRIMERNWIVNLVEKYFVKRGWLESCITHEDTEYKRYDIPQDLTDAIREQINLYRLATGHIPSKVIVGQDEQRNLLGQIADRFFSFQCPMSNDGKQIFGLTVEINPLISGIVVTE